MPAVARFGQAAARLDLAPPPSIRSMRISSNSQRRRRSSQIHGGGPLPLRREIIVDGISYAYPKSNRTALHGVSLTIPAGQLHRHRRIERRRQDHAGGHSAWSADAWIGARARRRRRHCYLAARLAKQYRLRAAIALSSRRHAAPEILRVPDDEIDETAITEAIRMARLTDLVAKLPARAGHRDRRAGHPRFRRTAPAYRDRPGALPAPFCAGLR